ncbi:hypothetical protein GCM10023259_102460 [Thermocatellispora tengchongensis]
MGMARSGAWHSETFKQKAAAVTFELGVEACGHYWPGNWIRGSGWAPAPASEFAVQNWIAMDENETADWRKILADLKAAATSFRRTALID